MHIYTIRLTALLQCTHEEMQTVIDLTQGVGIFKEVIILVSVLIHWIRPIRDSKLQL